MIRWLMIPVKDLHTETGSSGCCGFMSSSRAAAAEGWLLLLSTTFSCQHVCNAGPAAGAAASNWQREQPSRGRVIRKGNSCDTAAVVVDQAARGSLLPGLRGGGGLGETSAGGNSSKYTSRGEILRGFPGGRNVITHLQLLHCCLLYSSTCLLLYTSTPLLA